MRKLNVCVLGICCFWIFVACKASSLREEITPKEKPDTIIYAVNSAILKMEDICVNPPTPELHASTIEETPTGLVAAWFGGTKEKEPDVGIWLSRQENGKWAAPVEVITGITKLIDGSEIQYPCWNPVLYQVPNGGPLILFYKVGPTTPEWWGMLMRSTDGGKTWSEPERLPEGIYGPIKNKPVKIGEKGILSPSSINSMLHFERSNDFGKTWTRTASVTDRSIPVIQPSILLYGNERLQAVGRTLKDKRVFSIWSTDGGETWDKLKLLDLPNPNSGNDAVTLKDGRQLMVYNHSETSRTPLNIAISEDGENWYPLLVIENDKEGGYSYPAVIQSKDGLVHITYSWRRKNIRHVVLDPAMIKGKPLVSWNFDTDGIFGNETSSRSTYTNEALEVSVLNRGGGIIPQKAAVSFASAFPVLADLQSAEKSGAYYQFSVKAKSYKKISLFSIGVVLRVQENAPRNYVWKYSIDGGYNFKTIGKPITVSTGFTDNNGIQQPQVELSSINELQNIPSATKVIFRLYAWGGLSATQNNGFRIGKSNSLTPALVVNGEIK
ncbi:sialidase family protein [Pedobacter arcticus]|uniref:sialidase family protein n=1 Tax=Pedobacter arcticus TaxID=752140 RepID=UPI0003695608|nr:sialidase family protein [Pedobacter arcticus]